jgi:hypothetical protein
MTSGGDKPLGYGELREVSREEILTNAEGESIRVTLLPNVLPQTREAFHPSATHVDQRGMPVAFSRYQRRVDEAEEAWPFHPTPCCGAAASISDGPMYCKKCYGEVDYAFGNFPLEPFVPLTNPAS